MNILVKTVLLFSLMTTSAFAERWVCYDVGTKEVIKAISGDCKTLGICSGFNNAGLQDGCVEASVEEYESAQQGYKKFDPTVVSGNRIIDMTSAEKNAKDKPAKDAEKARQDLIDSLRTKLLSDGWTNAQIDIILPN